MTSSPRPETVSLAGLEGQYALQRELGRGGMGIVYLARDLKLERPVAIKALPPHVAAEENTRERFLREARTAGQLSHPNIVPIYRADELEGTAFFVMAYIDGESLADRVRDRGPLVAAEAVRVMREVAWALAYAHARGVVHRDVKPENIMIERGTGRAVVTDFGIARDVRASKLTEDGVTLGTVHYMSPEQVGGEAADGRSDLYALGVVGFYALTGRLPFDAPSASAVLLAHATRPAPRVSTVAPAVPPAVAAVIDRCLEKDPARRWSTGEELAEALERAIAQTPAEEDLPPGLPAVLSESQAAAIWRRAAQLQAEALQRLESRTLGYSGADGAAATSASQGFRLRDVREAAVEAGISRQFVALALAELPRDAPLTPLRQRSDRRERMVSALLGTAERSLAVSRTIRAAPARVLQAIGATLQQTPWELVLRESVGGHPLDGGVLVFDLPGPKGQSVMGGMNMRWMATRHQLEAKQVQMTLKPITGDPGSSEVTVYVDLRPGVRPNALVAASLDALGGGVGGLFGTVAALKLAGALTLATAGAPALLGGLAAGGLTAWWYRWLYRSVMDKSRRELDAALDAVEASLKSQDLFGFGPTSVSDLHRVRTPQRLEQLP